MWVVAVIQSAEKMLALVVKTLAFTFAFTHWKNR